MIYCRNTTNQVMPQIVNHDIIQMILFGLINARHIILQRKEEYQRGRRATGRKAAKYVLMRIDDKSDLLKMLSIKNLLSCLEIMFKDGNDFIEQYPVINRHFLDHGMLTRRVKRMDCVQIFLAYYNLIQTLEWTQLRSRP